MNPYRRRFDNQSVFPFEFVYKDTKSAQNELPNHLHDWYEIAFIYSGSGTFFIDQAYYDAEPGDLFLIPANTIHRSFPQQNNPKTATAMFFSASFAYSAPLGDSYTYLRCFELAKRERAYRHKLQAEAQASLIAALDRIQAELTLQQVGYRQAVQLEVHRMLLEFSRLDSLAGHHAAGRSSEEMPDWLESSFSYINEHLEQAECLRLTELAKRANVSVAHYSRSFKRFTGMNVTEFVTTKRIIRAKELLREKNSNVADIALACGFESIPHFHRTFKKLTGTTPAGYKYNE